MSLYLSNDVLLLNIFKQTEFIYKKDIKQHSFNDFISPLHNHQKGIIYYRTLILDTYWHILFNHGGLIETLTR